MIPKIIHFAWFGCEMPDWAKDIIERWRSLNPGYAIHIHDQTILAEKYRARWADLKTASEQSDLIRYSALQATNGGWWLDCDMVPLRPLDDLIAAYRLHDKPKLFVGELSKSNKYRTGHKLGAGIIGCPENWLGWDFVDHFIAEVEPEGWSAYGVELLNILDARHHGLIHAADPAWIYGPTTDDAAKLYRCLKKGRTEPLAHYLPETQGQMPFMFHLWAHKYSDRIEGAHINAARKIGNGKLTALIADNHNPEAWQAEDNSPMHAIARGLAGCGYTSYAYAAQAKTLADFPDIPDLLVVYNGLKGPSQVLADQAKKWDIPILFVEAGFWDRSKKFQVDYRGFSHRSSLIDKIHRLPPEVEVPEYAPVKARCGYCLILGQMDGDTQLFDSEFNMAQMLMRLINRNSKESLELIFRPHPLCHPGNIPLNAGRIKTCYREDRKSYLSYGCQGQTLSEALAGAAWCVAINSNALIEATRAGVPCLAFGPSLGIKARVYLQATKATIAEDIKAMMDGWHPKDEDVRSYLQWLSVSQYSCDDLANHNNMREILENWEIPHGE